MAIKGIFSSHQFIIGERATDFAGTILKYYPTGMAQLLMMTAGISSERATQTSYSWYEDQHISGIQILTAGGLGADLTVIDGSFYLPNQIFVVEETGEYVYATNVVNNVLTVARGYAETTPVSITNGMHLRLITNAYEEASTKPIAITQNGAPRYGVTQIFRNAWSISGTAKAIKLETDDRLARSRAECMMFHSEDMEGAFMWGRKSVGTQNGKQIRTTDGIITQIEQYGGTIRSAASNSGAGPVAGQLNQDDLADFVRVVMQLNVKGMPNERIAYCGDIVLQALQQMTLADSTYDIKFEETGLGINVGTFVTAFGKLKLMTHPRMSESTTLTKELYVLHPGGLCKKPFRDTFPDDYDKNGLRANGVDADEGILTTEGGIACKAARTMGIYRNISRGVKSVRI